MRILTLTNMYPPHYLGGYELSCADVMHRLEARGHDVLVLTTDMRVPGVSEPDEAGVHRTLGFYWRDHELLSPRPWTRLATERANQHRLRRALGSFQPDVVSVWNMGAMSLGLLVQVERRGVPMVLAVCDDWLVYGPRLDAWARMFASRPGTARVVEAAARVPTRLPTLSDATFCFVSDFVRRRAVAEGFARVGRSTVVFSGIERGVFPPRPRDGRAWSWRLLFVGRIDRRKGIETLVRALVELPDASLEFLGRGGPDYVRSVERLAADVGVAERVRFGVADRSAVADHYAAADAVVFPVEWDEPFGLVPVEAMACGIPVVATATGGSAEFLRDGVNCLRFRAGDPSDLARCVRALARDGALRARLVSGGYATAAELDTDRLADVFEVWHAAAAARFAHGTPPDRSLNIPASVEAVE